MNANDSLPFQKILFIEDDPGHAMLIQRVLKSFASEIAYASNLKAAVQLLKDDKFDLILSDLNLPDAKDTQIVSKLTSVDSDTPIIVLTSSTTVATAVDAMKSGAKDYLIKNFNADFKDLLSITLLRAAKTQKLERERKKLIQETLALRSAMESGADPLAVVAEDGEYLYRNPAYAELESYLSTEPSPQGATTVEALFSPAIKNCTHLKETLLAQIKSGDAPVWTSEFQIKGEEERFFRIVLSHITDDDGLLAKRSSILSLREVTEERISQKFQKEILATTTHDLKGPLGAIGISGELLQTSAENPEKIKKIASRIQSMAQSSLQMIEELLSARRIQEGSLILKPSPVNLSELCQDAVETFSDIATPRKIQITSEYGKVFEKKLVNVDKLALSRVVSNLLSNAIKFSPSETEIKVITTDKKDHVEIKIIDQGSGIEPHEIQKIFERFTRLAKHGAIGGTGIGLFVVKSLVEAHGGSIEVQSSPGKGTAFTISIPYEIPVNQSGELISLVY